MPGTGHRGQRMYMRIQVEYLDAATNAWHPVGTQGDSFRFYVGAATHKLRQGGMSFTYNPPASGKCANPEARLTAASSAVQDQRVMRPCRPARTGAGRS